MIAGLVPSLRGARPDLLPALREGVGASSSRTIVIRRGLLVAEASLAVLLLIGATLLGRSFIHLLETNPGYDAENVLTARVYLPGASRGRADSDAFVSELLPRLRAVPGVIAAGASNMAPLGQSTYAAGFTLSVPGNAAVTARALSYVVTPGYAESLKLRLVKGRLFDERDLASSAQMLLVNEQFVKAFLQEREPVGLRLPVGLVTDKVNASEIVGVVGDVLKDGLDQQPQAEIYVLAAHGATVRREVNVVLRTTSDPRPYADELRRIAMELRRDAAVDGVAPLSDQVSRSVAQPRFATGVLLAFALLALLLAAVGLYGVLSYTVARRRREIGVRSALGASRSAIVRLILREGMTIALLGLLIGVAIAAALTRLLRTLLVGVEPLDPASFLFAAATVLAVSLITCGLPARIAARTDPAIALRME
jgi:putative ABC transport system permease protein